MTKKIFLFCAFIFTLSSANAQFQQCANLALENTENNCAIPTTTLEAHFLNTNHKTTDEYGIDSEPACLPNLEDMTPTAIIIDDDWSAIYNIGFNFCYYGNMYDQFIVSDNGKLSFDLDMELQDDNNWNLSVGDDLPNPNFQPNAIFAPFFDTNSNRLPPGNGVGQSGSAMSFKLINEDQSVPENIGNRALIISFNSPSFGGGCNPVADVMLKSTIVLYEGSNVIDIEVREKNVCLAWNNGRALIGMQNKSATKAISPPGRGVITGTEQWDPRRTGYPGNMTIDSPDGELWRFVPDGLDLDYTFEWQVDYGDGAGYVTIDFPTLPEPPTLIEVNPENEANYKAKLTYQRECSFDGEITIEKVVTVTPPSLPNIHTPDDLSECEPAGGGAVFNIDREAEILGPPPPGDGYPVDEWDDFIITYHETYENASLLSTDAAFDPIPVADLPIYVATDGTIIYIRVEDATDPACNDFSRFFTLLVSTGDDVTFSYPDSGNTDPTSYCVSGGDLTPITTVDTVLGGEYTIDNGGVIDATTGVIDIDGATPITGDDGSGEFTITYATPLTNECTNSGDFTIKIADTAFTYPTEICINLANPVATNYVTGGTFEIKDSSGVIVSTNANGELDLSTITAGTYDITYAFTNCSSAIHQIEVKPVADATFNYPASGNNVTNAFCNSDTDPTPNRNDGTFTISNGGVIDTDSGVIDIENSGLGSDDTGLFTVTFAIAGDCPNSEDFDIIIIAVLDANFDFVTDVCINESNPQAFDVETSGGVFSVVGGTADISLDGVLDLSTTTVGTTYEISYGFNLSAADDCPSSSSRFIEVHDIPTATTPTSILKECNRGDNTAKYDLTALDDEIIGGQTNVTVTYYPTSTDATDDTNEILQTTEAIVVGNIWARVESANGCFSIVEITLEIEDCTLSLPEGFSPNSSVEDNQTFNVLAIENLYPNYTIIIYDRYGKLVFEGDSTKDNWNGKLDNSGDELPAGTYFYVIDLHDEIKNIVHKGWVYLQR